MILLYCSISKRPLVGGWTAEKNDRRRHFYPLTDGVKANGFTANPGDTVQNRLAILLKTYTGSFLGGFFPRHVLMLFSRSDPRQQNV